MTVHAAESLAALNVSRETILRLEKLVTLMRKWNPAINLVSKSTLEDAWTRHVLDSAQIYALADQPVQHWGDLGSGGGFPGLVVACIASELHPGMRMTLVEADQRKATFLREASRTLGIAPDIRAERVESLAPLRADVISARALAPLEKLCALTLPHLAPGGAALFLKGASHAAEVEAARKTWHFDLENWSSATDPKAVILKVKGLAHV
ncbi:16S rRNA (guanine(527)-N(7))-methyltransferase RsmG [Paracoccaceae bacterium Fryx2]|nr:16S rRNA (guanine(527)-N(7))-methyltransferase RsmG [Paracoccaceae bacterium Fryx2]